MQSSITERKRIDWIDYAKGIAAMLVICLHIPNFEVCKSVINSFVIPMFFILAGMTFSVRKENVMEFVKKRVFTLVWPSIAICGILDIILKSVYSTLVGIEHSVNIKKILLGTILQMRGSYDFGTWFLICLFTSQIIMYFLVKYIIKKPIHILILSVCFYIFWCAYSVIIHQVLPWSLDVAFGAVAYILFGYYIKETNIIKKLMDWKLFVLALIAFVIGNISAINSNNVISVYLNKFGNPVIALLTIVGGFIVTAFVCNLIKNCNILKFIGKNSLIIYCSQYAFIYFLDNTKLTGIFVVDLIIYFVAVLVGTIAEAYVIKKFCPILIGKRK